MTAMTSLQKTLLDQSLIEQPLIDQWLTTLIRQNLSSNTLQTYRLAISCFVNYLQNLQLKVTQCDRRRLARYVAYRLEVDAINSRSVRGEISAIRQFYAWLIDTKQATINPTTGYQLNTDPRPLPKIADIDLLSQLLDQEAPEKPAQALLWIRDKAMFELLYGSGLRVSELVSIDVNDIDLTEKQLRVIGKGAKTRLVPMSNKSITAIKDYLTIRYEWLQKGENASRAGMALFISERQGKRLSVRTVQQRLKANAKRAGIAQNLYPHLLRHCFASHVLSDSGDLRAVQEMLGHSDISTTQIYTQVDFAKLTQTYDTAHPRAKRQPKKQKTG